MNEKDIKAIELTDEEAANAAGGTKPLSGEIYACNGNQPGKKPENQSNTGTGGGSQAASTWAYKGY